MSPFAISSSCTKTALLLLLILPTQAGRPRKAAKASPPVVSFPPGAFTPDGAVLGSSTLDQIPPGAQIITDQDLQGLEEELVKDIYTEKKIVDALAESNPDIKNAETMMQEVVDKDAQALKEFEDAESSRKREKAEAVQAASEFLIYAVVGLTTLTLPVAACGFFYHHCCDPFGYKPRD